MLSQEWEKVTGWHRDEGCYHMICKNHERYVFKYRDKGTGLLSQSDKGTGCCHMSEKKLQGDIEIGLSSHDL